MLNKVRENERHLIRKHGERTRMNGNESYVIVKFK